MDEHRRAQARSDVRRTRRKITELRVEGEAKTASELGIEPVHFGVRGIEREARMQPLQAEMILLVQHDADPVLREERRTVTHPPVRLEPGELAAHEVALVEE